MPTLQPPKPPATNERKRPLEHPSQSGTAKRPRIDTPVLPKIPPAASNGVPTNIIFPVVGELTGVEADYIRLWQQTQQPTWQVQLDYDPDSVLAEELKKTVIESVNRLEEFRTRGPFSGDDDVYRSRVVKAKEKAYQDIRRILDNDPDINHWGDAVRQWLVNYYDNPGQTRRIDSIVESQQALRESLAREGVQLNERPVSRESSVFAEVYRQAVFQRGALADATNFLRDRLLYEQGGISPHSKSLPELAKTPAIQALLDSIQNPIDRFEAELAIQHAALDYLQTQTPENWSGRKAVSGDYPNYVENGLTASERASVQTFLQGKTERTLFQTLDTLTTGADGVLLGRRALFAPYNPVSVAAKPGAEALWHSMEEYRKVTGLIGFYETQTLGERFGIKQQRINLWRQYQENKQGLEQTISENTGLDKQQSAVKREFINRAEDLYFQSPSENNNAGFRDFLTAIETQPHSGILWGDATEALTGTPAIIRNIYRARSEEAALQGVAGAPTEFNGVARFSEEHDTHGSPAYYSNTGDVLAVPAKPQKKVIIIQLDRDSAIFQFAHDQYQKYIRRSRQGINSDKVYWAQLVRGEEGLEIRRYLGEPFTADSDTKVILATHSGLEEVKTGVKELRLSGLTQKTVAELLVVRKILKPDTEAPAFRKLSIDACQTCERSDLALGDRVTITDTKNSLPADLMLELHDLGVNLGKVIGRTELVNVGINGWVYSYHVDGSPNPVDGERVPFLQSREPKAKQEFTLDETGSAVTKDGKPIVEMTVKAGTAGTDEVYVHKFTSTTVARYQSSESFLVPVYSLMGELKNSPFTAGSPELNKHLEQLRQGLAAQDVLVPADINALLLGMLDSDGIGRITVSEAGTPEVAGIQQAVKLAGQARSRSDWLESFNSFPEVKRTLTAWLNQQPDPVVAFRRLQERANNGGFVFLTAEPASSEGAAFINNEDQSYAAIHSESMGGACGGGSRSRRQACSFEEINEQAREAVDGLTLLSDDETRILVGDSAVDIALHDATDNPVLAKVQEEVHEFRRSMARARVSEHEGYHNYIAIDDEGSTTNFEAAKALAKKDKGRALVYDSEHELLLTEDGRVVTLVEGGADNRLSLVSDIARLKTLGNEKLAEMVRGFCHEEKAGSLSLLALGGTEEEVADLARTMVGEGRELLDAVVTLSGVKTLTETGAGYTEGLLAGRFAGDDVVMKLPSETLPDSLLLNTPKLREQIKRGAVSEAKLRHIQEQLDRLPQEWKSLDKDTGVRFARQIHEFAMEFGQFRSALLDVYRENSLRLLPHEVVDPVQRNRHYADWVPVLGSIKETRPGHWNLTVFNKLTEEHINLDVTDPRIVRFSEFYDDKLATIRKVTEAGTAVHPEEIGEEFVDGAGWGFAAQSIVTILERQTVVELQESSEYPMSQTMKNALEVHAYLNLVFTGRVVTSAVLDVVKYAAALKSGVAVSLPERLAIRLTATAERIGGQAGKSLTAAAKGIRYAGLVFDTAIGLASIGLDIAEIVESAKSGNKVGVGIASTQLAFDSLSTALAIVGVVASVAGAAAAATVLSGAGVILGGLAVGITALVGNLVANSESFGKVVEFFDDVAHDMELSEVVESDDNGERLNLASVGSDRQRLAPVNHIDLRNREVTFGHIRLQKVKGGHARHSTRGSDYFMTGPAPKRGETFDLVEKGNKPRTRKLPDSNSQTLILPVTGDWSITEWDYQVTPGSTRFWNNHWGEKYLHSAEGNDFAFNWRTWMWFVLLPPWPVEYGLHKVVKQSFSSGASVRVEMPQESWTLVSPANSHSHYHIHSHFNSEQVLVLGSKTSYDIHIHKNTSFPQYNGDEGWTFIESRPDNPCQINRRPNSNEVTFPAHNKIHTGGVDVTFHSVTNLTRITVVDKDRNTYRVDLLNREYQTTAINEDLLSGNHDKLQAQLKGLLKDPHDRFILLTHSTDEQCASLMTPSPAPGVKTLFREWVDAAMDVEDIIHLSNLPGGSSVPEDTWPFSGNLTSGYYFFSASTSRMFFDSQGEDDQTEDLLIRFDGREFSLDPYFSHKPAGSDPDRSLEDAYFNQINPHLDKLYHDRKLFQNTVHHIPLGYDNGLHGLSSFRKKTYYWYDGQEETVIVARDVMVSSSTDPDDVYFPVAGNPNKGYFFYRKEEKQLYYDSQRVGDYSAKLLPFMYEQVAQTQGGDLFAVSTNGVNYLINYERTLTPLYIVGNYGQLARAITEINSLDMSPAHTMIPVIQIARGSRAAFTEAPPTEPDASSSIPTPTPTATFSGIYPAPTPFPSEPSPILVEQPVHTGFFDRSMNQMVLFSLVLLDDTYVGVRLPPMPLPESYRTIKLIEEDNHGNNILISSEFGFFPEEDINPKLLALLKKIGLDTSSLYTREWISHDWQTLFNQISGLVEHFGKNLAGSLPERHSSGAQPLEQLLQANQAALRIVDMDHVHYALYSPKNQRLFICRLYKSEADGKPHITREPLLSELQFGRDGEIEPNITSVLNAGGSVLTFTDSGLVLQVTEDSLRPLVDDAVNDLADLLLSVESSTASVSLPQETPTRQPGGNQGNYLGRRSAEPAPEETELHAQADLFIKNFQKVKAAGFVVGIDLDTVPVGSMAETEHHIQCLLEELPLRFQTGAPDALLVLPKIEKLMARALEVEGETASGSGDVSDIFQRSNIWYIRSLGRVLTGDRLQFLGVEAGTQKVLAVNANNWIVSYEYTLHGRHCHSSEMASGSSWQEDIPEPQLYNPDQIPLTSVTYDGFAIIGTDGEGYYFHITEDAQTLVAVDLSEDSGLKQWTSGNTIASLSARIAEVVRRKLDDLQTVSTESPLPPPQTTGAFRNDISAFDGYQPTGNQEPGGYLPEAPAINLSPRLDIYLPDNLKGQYKIWYDLDDIVRIFAGDDDKAHIVGVGAGATSEVTYFFAPAEGLLYKRLGEQQLPEGHYSDVKRLSNVLALLGTAGNDILRADDLIDLRPPASQLLSLKQTEDSESDSAEQGSVADEFLLYLEGQAGWDEYRVPAKALEHYPRIIINPAALEIASDNPVTEEQLIDLSDYPAYDFTGYRYENSLVLRHRGNDHEIIIQNVWLALDGLSALPPVEVRFEGGSFDLAGLAAQVLVNNGRLSLPLTLGSIQNQNRTIALGDSRQLFIDGRDWPSPNIRYDGDDLILDFAKDVVTLAERTDSSIPKEKPTSPGEEKHSAGKRDISGFNDVDPYTLGFTTARLRFKNYRHQDYALGDVWFTGPNQPNYAPFQYDDDVACHYCLNGIQLHDLKVMTDDFPSFPDFKDKNLWVSEDCLTWVTTGDCSLIAQKAEAVGYPMIPQHWLEMGVNFTVPERFPWAARQEPVQGYFSDVHVVMYGIYPGELSFTFKDIGSGNYQWHGIYNGWPVRVGEIHNSPDTSFGLTLDYGAKEIVENFRVVPFNCAKSLLRANDNHFRLEEGSDILQNHYQHHLLLDAPLNNPAGFSTDRTLARQMLSQLLSGYQGVYFTDGLKYRWQMVNQLASQPLTIVRTQEEGKQQWSATGNILNNIIPIQLREFGNYTVSGAGGNDLILVNGGFWASRISFPVTWSTTGNRIEEAFVTGETFVGGETVTLTKLDIQATSVTDPPLPTGYEMEINAGAGDDILGLSGTANVRIVESEGKDTVFLQHFGFADLKALRNGILFLKDIYSTEVLPVLYNSNFNISVDSLADATEVFLWSFRADPGRYIARLSPESVTEIHFADGKQVIDVQAWYENQAAVEDYEVADDGPDSGESGFDRGDARARSRQGTVESVEDTLEGAYTYALVSRGEPVAEGNAAFDGLEQNIQRLIQEMNSFRTNRGGGISPSLSTLISSPTATLTSPAHTSSIVPTPSSLPHG